MRICIRDPRNLFDPGSGMEKFGSWNRDKHPGSLTLIPAQKTLYFVSRSK
jgi:hypothetical protein